MHTVYFDNGATTRPSASALARMRLCEEELWGNPSSLHSAGVAAQRVISESRAVILRALGVRRAEQGTLVFTSGGTEANNLALLGVARAKARRGGEKIIISASEHASVAATAAALEAEGFTVARIPAPNGALDMDALRRELTPETVLVSLMHVNNETGAVYDVRTAFALAKATAPGCVTHTDAVQSFLKIPCAPEKLGADLLSVSAHKVHGPKGAGALYVSAPVIKAKKLVPIVHGGGQEGNFRSGTENVISIAGFGAAVEEGFAALSARAEKMCAVREAVKARIAGDPALSELRVNEAAVTAPHILSITLPRIKSETMLHFLSREGIFVSSGSACSSNGTHAKISAALADFGLSAADADCTIRLSFSEENTPEEADAFAAAASRALATLARI